MKINESNFVEELSHRNEKALEYVMVHYGGLVKSVTHRYLNVLSQYEEECINDVFFAVWEHIDSYDSARNPFANWIGGIARLKALDYKRKYAHFLLETSWENSPHTKGIDDAIELQTQFDEEFSEETKQMLSCLKPQDRELFIKLYVEEKPFDEISKEMNTKKAGTLQSTFSQQKETARPFSQNEINEYYLMYTKITQLMKRIIVTKSMNITSIPVVNYLPQKMCFHDN